MIDPYLRISNKIKYTILLFLVSGFLVMPLHAQESGVENLRETSKAFASIAKQVSPSVVFIQVESSARNPSMQFSGPGGDPFGDEFLRRFFGDQLPHMQPPQGNGRQPPRQKAIGQGSGFVYKVDSGLIKDKTYIMTNNHVVENADRILVKFNNGKEYEAKVTGTDPKSDIAVIEVKTDAFRALPIGNSAKLDVGEWVVAIGNPFGLNNTLTVGVVSAKGRTSIGINDYEDFIQTDAAINPGNSGGPLVNLDGKVVGMNTAIFSRSGGYMGIGFAIPINLAKSIAEQLISQGEVTRGHIGVVIQPLTEDLAHSFGIKPEGILVAQVADDSPAERAGLQQGDIIVSYRGQKVVNIGNFRNRVALTQPGKSVDMTIIRDGKRRKLSITIGKQDQAVQLARGSEQSSDEIGMVVQTLTPELARQFGVNSKYGVVVTQVKPGSVAASAGIQPGTVILQVNRRPVKNASEFKQALQQSDAKNQVLLLVKTGNYQRYIVLNR